MSSNLILNDGIIKKLNNKKLAKEKKQKQTGLKSGRKKPNKDKVWKQQSKLSPKNWEND